jgi:hypothetical protein
VQVKDLISEKQKRRAAVKAAAEVKNISTTSVSTERS